MDDHERIRYLEGLLEQALPFLQIVDLMGTGGRVPKKEYEELNNLELEIVKVIDEDPGEYGLHSDMG